LIVCTAFHFMSIKLKATKYSFSCFNRHRKACFHALLIYAYVLLAHPGRSAHALLLTRVPFGGKETANPVTE